MAIAAGTIFECNASATAGGLNAGGFNPGNANFLTDLTTDTNTANTNSPVVSSASYNFVAGDVGAWVFIKAGTNWTPGYYQIASVASNKATLSAAIGQANQLNAAQGFPTPKWNANTVAGCATVGTPTGGTWGIDYSRGTNSRINGTDLASTNGTTNPSTITSAGTPLGVQHTGNLIHITAGTNWTQGWYEIVSVSGVTATLDRAVGTSATISSGTFRLGGAMSLNSTLDDDFFELAGAASRFFIKNGSYIIGENLSITATGTSTDPCVIEGYDSIRGDAPTANMPVLNYGSSTITLGVNFDVYFCTWTGANTAGVTVGINGKLIGGKYINSTTTATRSAISTTTGPFVFKCEVISYRGRGFSTTGGGHAAFVGNYVHDCDIGFNLVNTTGAAFLADNIIAGCVTAGVRTTGAATSNILYLNNTFFGSPSKLGAGIIIDTGGTNIKAVNNIFSGLVTGVVHADSQTVGFDNYNDFYNNTNNVSASGQWQMGSFDVAVDPAFTNVTQLTGATATVSASVLTQTGADFSSVVDNIDFIYIASGTGVTAGKYLITAHTTTTLTLSSAPGNSAGGDVVWQITLGNNYLPTGAI
jgi:hypothetical protein